MAEITSFADLIRQSSFLGAGGKPEGQRDIDKANQIFGTIKKGGDDYLASSTQTLPIIKNLLEAKAAKLKIGDSEYAQSPEQRDLANRFTESQIQKNMRGENGKKFINESDYRARVAKGEVLSPNEYQIVQDPTAGEKPKTYISESDWRRRSASGEQLSARDFQIVPDPLVTEQAGTINPAQAGTYTLAQESMQNIANASKVLFPDGTPQSFQRGTATSSNIPGSALPVIGNLIPNASPFNKDAQNVNRWIGNALTARQLIQTGVTARPDETQALVRRFMAGVASNPEAAMSALKELSGFYEDYNTVLTTRKPLPPRPMTNLDAILNGNVTAGTSGVETNDDVPVGTIQKGEGNLDYRYIGGGRYNQSNWVRVQ